MLCSCAQGPESGRLRSDVPESAGMSSQELAAIAPLLQEAIDNQIFPGASVAVIRNGIIVYQEAFGFHDYDRSEPVRTSDIFDLASISKVLGTTLGIMKLVDSRTISLDDHVSMYFPEFASSPKDSIQIRHLLTHTSGLPAFRVYVDSLKSRPEIIQAILNEPLINPPGAEYLYSDLGMITAGLIIEKVTGKRQDDWLQETFYGPLAMIHTTYNPAQQGPDILRRIPPAEIDTVYRHQRIQGTVHDERAYYMDGVAGHAGLFSTTADLAIFDQLLLNGGHYAGKTYLSEEVIATFIRRQPPHNRRALGFDMKLLEGFTTAGQLASEATYGHLGFTGTSLWIDPERQVAIILLTNRTWPFRGETSGIARVRATLSDIVLSSISE
jgi:CubicO group peptidase (beta-lactamase class C family)